MTAPVTDDVLSGWVRTLQAVAPVIARLGRDEHDTVQTAAALEAAAKRGYFTHNETEIVRARFAEYLTVRAALRELIAEVSPLARSDSAGGRVIDEHLALRAFVIAYTAACLLVRAARYLVNEGAADRTVQRKLNEADPAHRIPARQYTAIYRSLTHPGTGWRLLEARRFADAHERETESLRDDPIVGAVITMLDDVRDAVQVPARRFLLARLRYRRHSARRRGGRAVQEGLFLIAEAFGRVIADIHLPWRRDGAQRVHAVHDELVTLLQPGDVIVTRHDDALSNLFLPGFWPHAALHVGDAAIRSSMQIDVDEDRAARWREPLRVLEARKDGVLLRALDDTLAVDAVAVIRPLIDRDLLCAALSRAIRHEGKLYNFDFDFFCDDRLVCTEVVYRAYDGVGPLHFDLRTRAGRPTLSAEDLLDMAVDERGFEAVAVYGGRTCRNDLVTGGRAREALAATYRLSGPA